MSARNFFRRKTSTAGHNSLSGSVNSGLDGADASSSLQSNQQGDRRRSGESASEGSSSRKDKSSTRSKGRRPWKRSDDVSNPDDFSLDRPIPRTHRSRELLDAFLDQVEKDLQETSIGSSALRQLHDIKAQLAADEDNELALIADDDSPTMEESGSMSGACISVNISTPSAEERISRNQSSEAESKETAKAANGGKGKKRDTRADSNAETVPTTVDASEELLLNEDEASKNSSLSDESDLTGLTGVFSSNPNKKGSSRTDRRLTVDTADVVLERPEDRKSRLGVPKTSGLNPHRTPRGCNKRAVTFQSVYVRSYERILENNPSCTSGPSIGLGWRYEIEHDYERIRQSERRDDLVLSRDEREDLLLDLGYSERELAQAVRNMIKDKNKRRQTVQNLNTSGAEEVLESAGKRVRKFLGRRKKGSR